MNFHELLPIASGLFAGSLLSFIPAPWRLSAGALLIVLFGVFAAFASGELLLSWAFVLIDVPLAAVAALAGFGFTRYLQRLFFKNPI